VVQKKDVSLLYRKSLKNKIIMKANDLKTFNLFDQVLNDNAGESYRTIWEIYCWQQDLNEDSQGREAKLFDMWIDYKTFGNIKKSLVD
jgi:hypothetical protein